MKMIYVAHPFGGEEANKQAVADICRKLVKLGVMPVSPVHMFSFMNDGELEERQRALELCEDLVEIMDELWLFGDWKKSEGCHNEHNMALLELVPVYEIVGWYNDMPIFAGDNVPEFLKGWLPILESGGK